MKISERFAIGLDGGISLPIVRGWSFIPLEACGNPLTDYIDNLITYSYTKKKDIEVEYLPIYDTVELKHIDIGYHSTEQIIDKIKEKSYVYDALVAPFMEDVVLICLHVETSFIFGETANIEEVAGKSIDKLQKDYLNYANSWSGEPHKWSKQILSLSYNYEPLAENGQSRLSIPLAEW